MHKEVLGDSKLGATTGSTRSGGVYHGWPMVRCTYPGSFPYPDDFTSDVGLAIPQVVSETQI